MTEKSLISVVIPAYQSAETLPRAVQSVLRQDYPHLEVIVVDNGSTDNTQEVIRSLMELDGRVRMVHLLQNARPAGGRNAGVQHASGAYVAFLDADDEWLPGKLTAQAWALDHFPQAGIIISDGWIIDTATRQTQRYSDIYAPYFARLTLNLLAGSENLFWLDGPFRRTVYEKCFLNTSSVLLRRDLFLTHGGFNPQFFGPEDVDLWVRLARDYRFVYCDAPLVNRYVSAGNLSAVGERWLMALLAYHQACFVSDEYTDLKSLAVQNLFKYYRMLVVHHGRQRSMRSWKLFAESLRYGFDPRLPLYVSLTPFGAPAYDLGEKLLDWVRSRRRQ